MKHQRIRTAAIAASTLGLAVGATLVSVGHAQAATRAVARPNIVTTWYCQSTSTLYNGSVTGYICTGSAIKTGLGWIDTPASGGGEQMDYLCRSFTYSVAYSDYYTVFGSTCTAQG
jgi:hypothetical protein